MIRLEYFDGEKWIYAGEYVSEYVAWMSLGNDNSNYRTCNADTDEVLTTNRKDITDVQ